MKSDDEGGEEIDEVHFGGFEKFGSGPSEDQGGEKKEERKKESNEPTSHRDSIRPVDILGE